MYGLEEGGRVSPPQREEEEAVRRDWGHGIEFILSCNAPDLFVVAASKASKVLPNLTCKLLEKWLSTMNLQVCLWVAADESICIYLFLCATNAEFRFYILDLG
jgi:hypothetical protein